MYKYQQNLALKLKALTVLLLIFLLSKSLIAADMAGRYLISGIGKDSCISYIDADEEGRAYYLTWLSGYITSHNFYVEDTYSIANKKTVSDIEEWLRGYCFSNTHHSFEQAVKGLVRSLEYTKKKNYYDD